MPPSSVPASDRQLVGGAQQRVRAAAGLRRDEVRQARVGGRPGEAGGDAGDERERDDLPRLHGERRAATNTASRTRSAPTSSRLRESRSTSGPSRRPIATAGQEVGDQQRADPHAGVRPVPDVDAERDHREPRAEPRDQRRAEEQPEARRRAQHVPLAGEDQRQRHGRDVSASARRRVRARARRRRTRSRPASRR